MKEQIKRISWAGLVCCIVFSFAFSAYSQKPDAATDSARAATESPASPLMSNEEKLVRLAYKKLEVYNSASKYRDGRTLQGTSGPDASLKFELSDFKVIDVIDAKNARYRDMVSESSGGIIQLIQQTIRSKGKNDQVAYKAE